MRRLAIAAIAAAATTFAVVLPAVAWDVIGVTRVDGRKDRDFIEIDDRSRFHRLAICAERGPVRIDEIVITFRNGSQQRVDLETRLEPGSCTRAIDFRGRGRRIESVELAFGRFRDDRWRHHGRHDEWNNTVPVGWNDWYDRRDGRHDDRYDDRRPRRAVVRILAE